ncbi:MAG: hypothetical protein O3A29_16425, partial [Planctomycetota bacterium]|nr:hypothetical protein [Planctomycetota bacterium]
APPVSTAATLPPRRHFGPPSTKSPTFNRKTHDRWGSHHLRSLDELHKSTEPTHWATIKFNRIERVDTINTLLDSLGTAIRYQNKKKITKSFNGTLAIFGVMNPEPDGSVHYHVLIRSTLPDPAAFLNKKLKSHNRKHGTIATVCYCEQVTTAKGATTYGFKLGSEDKLIFCSGSGLRHVFQSGNYFDGKLKRALERRSLWIWQDEQEDKFLDHLRAMEIAAEKIVDCNGDCVPTTPPKRTLADLPRLRLAPPTLLRDKAQRPLLCRKRTKSRPRIRSPCKWP